MSENDENESIGRALGLSAQREDELIKNVRMLFAKLMMTKKDSKWSDLIKCIMSNDSLTKTESLFCAFVAGGIFCFINDRIEEAMQEELQKEEEESPEFMSMYR